jgi:serine/threonine protein kinase
LAEGSERKKAAPKAASEHPNRHKRVGTSVRGKYRVDAFLATGTMANVYSATHRNGARVALKILHKQLAEDPSLCERFKREGYFANSIGHPGIVRAIDDDVTEDGCPFLVMELLEGETLEERRRRKGGRLPASWVLPIADSLLEILAAAHEREVVHRDLKPDNVFVTKGGDVKVLDFGVARWNDGQTSSDMTAVGMVLGTPAYMPPEQALGRREDVDAQSDIWAVGATLFVVLSGESVHVGGDAKAKLIATARTAARPIREAAPDVPRSVAAVIDRALAFHKSERWPDAHAMREALRWARMSLDERPSQQTVSSTAEVEAIAPPVETRRNMGDDEPTLMRSYPRDDSMPGSGSRDFLTSAPPITLRDVPRSTAVDPSSVGAVLSSNNEPIFSLRREKEGAESISPSTERYPKQEGGHPKPGSVAAKTSPGIGDLPVAPVMTGHNPSAVDALAIEAPSSVQEVSLSGIDVSLSFTRPMAAMVMPADWPVPRPAAGAPASAAGGDPGFGATFPEPYPSPQAYPSAAPPQISSAPPGDLGTAATQLNVPTDPPRQLVQLEPESLRPRTTLPPGPMLAQMVKPRGGTFLRVWVPVMLGFVAVAAAFIALRTRAANARARAASAAMSASVASASVAAMPSTNTSASPSGSASASASAAPEPTDTASAVVAAAAPAEPPKKKKKKPRPRPAVAAEPAVEPAAAEPAAPPAASTAPAPTPPPVDTTPRDSLPTKDPEP